MEDMRVVSVNVGAAKQIQFGGRGILTGIDKQAISTSVRVAGHGIRSDAVVDTEHHGGLDQAIYVYSQEDYMWWSERLGRAIAAGTFGDNLTISGLPNDMRAGDRLLIGDLVLEATSPRIPCNTLAAQMQDKDFVLTFRRAERPGSYFRVLNEGDVAAGDSVTCIENSETDVTLIEQFRLYYAPGNNTAALQRVLDAPIAERFRRRFQKALADIQATA